MEKDTSHKDILVLLLRIEGLTVKHKTHQDRSTDGPMTWDINLLKSWGSHKIQRTSTQLKWLICFKYVFQSRMFKQTLQGCLCKISIKAKNTQCFWCSSVVLLCRPVATIDAQNASNKIKRAKAWFQSVRKSKWNILLDCLPAHNGWKKSNNHILQRKDDSS